MDVPVVKPWFAALRYGSVTREELDALIDIAEAAQQLVRRDITIEVVALCEANLIAALAADPRSVA